VHLPFEQIPQQADICIGLGRPVKFGSPVEVEIRIPPPTTNQTARRLERFIQLCERANVSDRYIIAHARLAADALNISDRRKDEPAPRNVAPLPPVTKQAADQLYQDTADRLLQGFTHSIGALAKSKDPTQRELANFWQQASQ
jgi:hypothetical protein